MYTVMNVISIIVQVLGSLVCNNSSVTGNGEQEM